MSRIPKLTDEQITEARYWRARGMSWERLGKAFDVSLETMRRTLDPDYAEHRAMLARNRARRIAPQIQSTLRHEVRSYMRPSEEEFRRMQKLIPPDTRDLTARLMGDPLPNDPRRAAKGARG